MGTFVSVGNAHQPFPRLLNAVARIETVLPQPVIVQYGHTPFSSGFCRAVAFMSMDEFTQHMRVAELVILHAGAGSVINAIEEGKVPVIMSRSMLYGEHVNDHQIEFSRALADAGKVVVANSADDLARAVEEAMTRQKEALVKRGSTGETPKPPLTSIIERVLKDYAQQYTSKI